VQDIVLVLTMPLWWNTFMFLFSTVCPQWACPVSAD
jgi:hypothetical protein